MSDEHAAAPPGADGPILVAVDFTADSEAALVWACDHADRIGATVKVLHVVHDPGEAPGYYHKEGEDQLRPMEDVANEMLGAFIERIGKEHPASASLQRAEPVLAKGIPETRILETAQRDGTRLIVMGSRGRTGLPHLLLGSKAERVVQLSPVPVTIVKAQA